MEINTMGISKMIKKMEKEQFIIIMEINLKENLKIIKKMEWEKFF